MNRREASATSVQEFAPETGLPAASLRQSGFAPREKSAEDRALTRLCERPRQFLELAQLPTPVARAPWLDGPRAHVWIKRDELSCELYGGGKVRKLEWLLGSQQYDNDFPVISVGGIGSHHLLALALHFARSGRRLHALTFPQRLTTHVRQNLAALVSLGTRFWHVPSRVELPLAYLSCRSLSAGRNALWMDAGGSSAVGSLGFVSAGLELAEQVASGQLPQPTRIFVPGGTGGTPAGLILGLALARLSTVVHVVSSVEPWLLNTWTLRHKMMQIHAELRRLGVSARSSARELCKLANVRFVLDHAQLGAGYGEPTEVAQCSVGMAASRGIALETTYSGKCLAALQLHVARDTTQGPVLFWNTNAARDLTQLIKPGWEVEAEATGIRLTTPAAAGPGPLGPLARRFGKGAA